MIFGGVFYLYGIFIDRYVVRIEGMRKKYLGIVYGGGGGGEKNVKG